MCKRPGPDRLPDPGPGSPAYGGVGIKAGSETGVWKGGDLVNVHRTIDIIAKGSYDRTLWRGDDLVNVHPYVPFGRVGI